MKKHAGNVKLCNLQCAQIYDSQKWGFTKWNREVYETMLAEGLLVPDGVSCQYKPAKGPLSEWKHRQG